MAASECKKLPISLIQGGQESRKCVVNKCPRDSIGKKLHQLSESVALCRTPEWDPTKRISHSLRKTSAKV